MFVIIVLSGFSFYQSDFFLVKEIEVEGLQLLTANEVKRYIGLEEQVLIWRIEPKTIERNIVENLPRVQSVQVKKRLPNKLIIHLIERQDAALLSLQDGGYLLLDPEGVPVEEHTEFPGKSMPVINGIKLEENVRLGQPIDNAYVRRAMAVIRSFGRTGSDILSEVDVDHNGSVTLFTISGTPVYFGSDDNWELKVQALLGILEDLSSRNARAKYIDLRSAFRPVIQEK